MEKDTQENIVIDDSFRKQYQKQYQDNVYTVLSERGYKFKDAVMHDRLESKSVLEPVLESNDIPVRWAEMKGFDAVEMVDDEDKIKSLIDPTNPYVVRQAEAIGHEMNIEIHRALVGNATVMRAEPVDGENIIKHIALPEYQKIRLPVNATNNSDGGLTVDKLLEARQILMEADNMLEDDEFYLIVTPANIMQLLRATQVGSQDHSSVRALVNGETNKFAGFKFIWWKHLPRFNRVDGVQTDEVVGGTVSTDTTSQNLVAFAKSGIQLNDSKEIKTAMERRVEERNRLQLLTSTKFGACRKDEQKVVTIECLIKT